MKKLIIITLCLTTILTASCKKSGIKVTKTENPNFDVVLLFTIDSCNVYRFNDGGESHYIVTGKKAISVEKNWTEQDSDNNSHHKQETIFTK